MKQVTWALVNLLILAIALSGNIIIVSSQCFLLCLAHHDSMEFWSDHKMPGSHWMTHFPYLCDCVNSYCTLPLCYSLPLSWHLSVSFSCLFPLYFSFIKLVLNHHTLWFCIMFCICFFHSKWVFLLSFNNSFCSFILKYELQPSLRLLSAYWSLFLEGEKFGHFHSTMLPTSTSQNTILANIESDE